MAFFTVGNKWGKKGKEGKVGTRETGVNSTDNRSKYEKQNMNLLYAFIIDIYGFL